MLPTSPELLPALGTCLSSTKTMHQHIAIVTQSSFCIMKHPHFISPDTWPANIRDLNPVEWCIWDMPQMQKRVYQVPIRDTDDLHAPSACRDTGCSLIFSRAWWTMRLISGEKDWKPVPRWSWSQSWTLAATSLLAWHSSCHITQLAVFRATNVWTEIIWIPFIRWMSSAFHP